MESGEEKATGKRRREFTCNSKGMTSHPFLHPLDEGAMFARHLLLLGLESLLVSWGEEEEGGEADRSWGASLCPSLAPGRRGYSTIDFQIW